MTNTPDTLIRLPHRAGPRPRTTSSSPHLQRDQHGPREIWTGLADRIFALPEIEERLIPRADPPERGIWLRAHVQQGPRNAFLQQREIGHFHPWDGSMHIALPPAVTEEALKSGWAEIHPVARVGGAPTNYVMLYTPRDGAEADVLFELVTTAVARASGKPFKRANEHADGPLATGRGKSCGT
jgi:hypothetical protein